MSIFPEGMRFLEICWQDYFENKRISEIYTQNANCNIFLSEKVNHEFKLDLQVIA